MNQRRSYQQRIFVDSPIWKRQQRQLPLETIAESNKTNDRDSGFFRDIELSTSAPSEPHISPIFRRQTSSQSNKIFIISDNHPAQSEAAACEPQNSSLYRIVNRGQEAKID